MLQVREKKKKKQDKTIVVFVNISGKDLCTRLISLACVMHQSLNAA